ncbi:uncharacterized protein LOC141533870 [Cotesia typhae]|uniref:uncharacterized protein LOC141533870 n=1 Tax=Cotesia typhae TaxID=2053667 RepID=UPI003D69E0B0
MNLYGILVIELNNPPAVPLRRKKTSSNNKLLICNLSPKQPIKNIIITSGASSSNKLIKEDDKNLIKYSSNLNKKLNIPIIKEPQKIQEDKKLKIKNNPTLLFTTRDFESVMEHSEMNRDSDKSNLTKFPAKKTNNNNNNVTSEETTCFTITASNLPFATFKRELTNENFPLNKNNSFNFEDKNKFFTDLKIQNLENKSKENDEKKMMKNGNKIDEKTPNQMKNDLLNELVTNFNDLKLKKISITSQVTDKNNSDKKLMVEKKINAYNNSNKNNNGINCVISMNNSACNIGKKTDDKDLEIDNYNNDTTSLKIMKKNNNSPILPAKIISNFTDDKISLLCINNNNNNNDIDNNIIEKTYTLRRKKSGRVSHNYGINDQINNSKNNIINFRNENSDIASDSCVEKDIKINMNDKKIVVEIEHTLVKKCSRSVIDYKVDEGGKNFSSNEFNLKPMTGSCLRNSPSISQSCHKKVKFNGNKTTGANKFKKVKRRAPPRPFSNGKGAIECTVCDNQEEKEDPGKFNDNDLGKIRRLTSEAYSQPTNEENSPRRNVKSAT